MVNVECRKAGTACRYYMRFGYDARLGKQKILEMFDPGERLEYINEKLQREINILNIKKDIESKVKKKMEKSQRDYYLREELKVIHEELGDEEEVQSEIDELRKKLGEKNLPESSKKAIEKELSRMKEFRLLRRKQI